MTSKQTPAKTIKNKSLLQRVRKKLLDWCPDKNTLMGVFIGALITLFVSSYYYVQGSKDLIRASQDLLRETERSRIFLITLIRSMEAKQLIDVEWDAEGNPTDFKVKGIGNVIIPPLSASGIGKVET